MIGALIGDGDRGDQGVDAADTGIAEPCPLLGISMNLDDRVVHIDQHIPAHPGQQRGGRGQAGQHPAGDRIQLPDMTEGERAEK